MSTPEFIAFCAMLSATVAFSIDSMLPGLPEIAAELVSKDPNKVQLVLTSFVLGMGIGTFFVGPLSDRFGRQNIILIGSAFIVLARLRHGVHRRWKCFWRHEWSKVLVPQDRALCRWPSFVICIQVVKWRGSCRL